jgi:hypothetical protein
MSAPTCALFSVLHHSHPRPSYGTIAHNYALAGAELKLAEDPVLLRVLILRENALLPVPAPSPASHLQTPSGVLNSKPRLCKSAGFPRQKSFCRCILECLCFPYAGIGTFRTSAQAPGEFSMPCESLVPMSSPTTSSLRAVWGRHTSDHPSMNNKRRCLQGGDGSSRPLASILVMPTGGHHETFHTMGG